MAEDDLGNGVSQQVETPQAQRRERPLRRVGHRPTRQPEEAPPERAQPPGGFGERRDNHQDEDPVFAGQQQMAADDLDLIINDERQFPMALRILAQRLQATEQAFNQNLPSSLQIGQSLIQLDTRMRQIEPQVTYLSQQRAVAEMSMERHTRSMALDLAIKSLTDEQKAGDAAAVLITTLADAFLRWMKTGENH